MTLGSERSEQEESGKNLRKGGKKNTRKKEEALFSLSLLLRLSENKREREREEPCYFPRRTFAACYSKSLQKCFSKN